MGNAESQAYSAAVAGDATTLCTLLKERRINNVDWVSEKGHPILWVAAKYNNKECVQLLLQARSRTLLHRIDDNVTKVRMALSDVNLILASPLVLRHLRPDLLADLFLPGGRRRHSN